YAIKDTKSIFYSMITSCIINLILCYPLINILGINGANISIAISFIINISIRTKILSKKIGFKLNFKEIIKYAVLIIITNIVFLTNNIIINLVWMIIMIITTFIILKDDIRKLLSELKEKISFKQKIKASTEE
ncbi:MAG TPA: hypothetical protein GX708_13950, partial [Gallicola sp.]|nr:hypothetical protein [Gallicola sp.]